jgi:DNA primase
MMAGTARTSTPARRGEDDWVERVRAASDIVEIIGQTVALKRSGRNWIGLCPFHAEKTPSFSVNAERQFYHCFGCKAGGDVFRFVQETEHVGFVDAVELLSRRAGIPIPERRGERNPRQPVLDALEAAAQAYEQWLADPATGARPRAYLAARGITPEAVRTFRLGFAPEGWDHLTQRLAPRVGIDRLVDAGLAARRERGAGAYDRFRGRVMIPLVAPGGDVVGFGARSLEPDQQPKYLNSPETAVYRKGAFLFGLEQARRVLARDGEIVAVEGYFDVIAMHQAGVANVVAASGTALTADHARQLKRVAATVLLTFDADAAGRDAMLRSLGTLLAAGLEVRIVELPAGQDPDVLLRSGGPPAWETVRRGATDAVEFVQKQFSRRGAPGDPREQALQEIVTLAAQLDDPVRERLFLERAAQVFGVGDRVLHRALALRRQGNRAETPITAAVRTQRGAWGYAERQVVRLMLEAAEHRDEAHRHLTAQDFEDPACRSLAEALWNGEAPEGEAVVLERELLTEPVEGDTAAELAAFVRKLMRRRYERRRRDVRQELTRLQRLAPGDPAAIDALLAEHVRLGELIRDLEREPAPALGEDPIPSN